MTLDRVQILLPVLIALVAWGLAVRLAPFLWHLANAFFVGVLAAGLTALYLICTTSKTTSDKPINSQRPFLASTLPVSWPKELANYNDSLRHRQLALHPSSANVSEAASGFIGLAIRDFIGSWYKSISPRPAFANKVDLYIRLALIEVRDRVLNQDVVDMIVARMIPIVTEHLREYENAEKVVKGRVLNRSLPESEELDLAIAAKYKEGQLHPAASLAYSDTKTLQQEHIRKILVRLLPLLLDASVIKSRAVLVLVKEIVACAVLCPVFQMLSDPDIWNQLIEAYGKTTLQDRKTVKRMRAALDEHTSPVAKREVPIEIPRLQPHDSERAFEKFVRAIRKTKTLADVRRFRSQIASQLARESQVEGQDPVFLRRLEMGKRVLDQKVAKMMRSDTDVSESASGGPHAVNVAKIPSWSLAEIMRTASGLSYFMEFMDRQRRMSLVQFWVVVDGFRNPLEDDFGDEQNSATITWTDTDRLDIAQIAETYIMKSEMDIPTEFKSAVEDFLQAGRKASPEQYRTARMAILSSQSAVLEELEQTFLPKFRESDLYFKFLASDENQAVQRKQGSHVTGLPPMRASPISRASSHVMLNRPRDLRRAALSSSDVKSLAASKANKQTVESRRSLDTERPLFDDDLENDPLAQSVQSLGGDSGNGDQAEPDVIENMEAALEDIMAQSPNATVSDVETDNVASSSTSNRQPIRPSLETIRTDSTTGEKLKPSLATLGLVNTSGRIGVFQDNDLFGDEERFAEDEYADRDEDGKREKEEQIHQAAPGDLGLAEAITALSDNIERLVSQEAVVDTLTRKAELTNNVAELRILGKSKASLQREIRRKEMQRQQYIVQESDNSLYGRATVNIDSVMVGREDDGQEYAVYIIKVRRQAGDQMADAAWAIAHRYSEFHDLHQRLRRRYPSTRTLEFPRRRMVMKLQKQFLHNRRLALQAYLQKLLRMPDVCRSREFRSFLSQQAITQLGNAGSTLNAADTQDMVTRIYNSVTDGMDEFLGNVAVLDQLSAAGQNLISAATSQIATNSSTSPMAPTKTSADEIIIEPGSMAEAEAELHAFDDKELAPFVKPICDIFLEVFELNRGNNWLRGRAVVVVIHQLLGGTVERKVRDSFTTLFSEDTLLRYIETAKNMMWPFATTVDPDTGTHAPSTERKLRLQQPPRTKLQKEQSRKEAALVLSTLIPEVAGSVVGRANAQAAARKIHTVMNNKRLNEHLVYTLLDEVVVYLFSDTVMSSGVSGTRTTKNRAKGKVPGKTD